MTNTSGVVAIATKSAAALLRDPESCAPRLIPTLSLTSPVEIPICVLSVSVFVCILSASRAGY